VYAGYVVLDALAGGDTFEMIQRDYDIKPDDVRACIALAAGEIEQFSPSNPVANGMSEFLVDASA
jgi:uncharacterized protein (DUF433 family)